MGEKPCNFRKLEKAFAINFRQKHEGFCELTLFLIFLDIKKSFFALGSKSVRKEENYYSRIPFMKQNASFFRGY